MQVVAPINLLVESVPFTQVQYSTVQYSTDHRPPPPGVVQPGLAPARPHLLHRQRPPAPPAPRRPRGGDQAHVCLASCIVFRKRSSPPSKWQMKSLSPSLSKPNRFCGQDIAFRLHIHNRAANDPSAKLYNHREVPYYCLLPVESGYYCFHI